MIKQKFYTFVIFVLFYVIFFNCVTTKKINNYTHSHNGLIFYNLKTNRTLLPPIVTSEKYTLLKLPRIGLPCTCENLQCGCCVGMNAQQNNMHFCTNFTYNPIDFAIKLDVSMNDKRVYENKVSARDPSPLCIPVPIPYIPISIDMCIKLFDISTPGYNLHMCMDMIARIERAPVIVLHFECMRMGQDGIAFLKPGESENGLGGGVVESNGGSDGSDPPQQEFETYDEVSEIKIN